jgi:L-threonylcarbamoyladenylate synthase
VSYVTDKFDDNIIRLLKNGGVGLLPTDTIYGLSCRALDEHAVKRLRKIKSRDKSKPFIILISEIRQLNDLGIITTDAAPVLRYWPGKLTLICDAQKSPLWLHMGTHTLAVRQPDYEELRQLISQVGPIISTSANLKGGAPAVNINEAKKYFSDKLDFYVDAGRLGSEPSTIVKASFAGFEVIRPGAVKIDREEL